MQNGLGIAGAIAPHSAHELPLYIVFNVASGSGDGPTNQRVMQEILREAGREHEFFLVRDPRELAANAERAAQKAARNGGAVIVAGGDGTINTVAQATLHTSQPFGIVPQGTFNYTSRANGIPLETAEATRALLSATPTRMQVGVVNDRVFLVNASLGLYPQLLQDRETHKRQFGRYRSVAFASAISTILRGNGLLNLELEHDSVRESVRTPSLFVGNNALQLEQTGLPEAEVIGQQQLAGVLLRASNSRALLGLMLRGAMGKLDQAEQLRRFPFNSMHVRPALRGVRKLKVALDGEIHWMKPPLVFRVAEQPLWLLTPHPTPAESA
ncbi:MAG TPA: diacylglycerol kinase family protein [Polyangiales bacterium]|nr:diacylglycerol kinase family protein [Polyangiales bacterium]